MKKWKRSKIEIERKKRNKKKQSKEDKQTKLNVMWRCDCLLIFRVWTYIHIDIDDRGSLWLPSSNFEASLNWLYDIYFSSFSFRTYDVYRQWLAVANAISLIVKFKWTTHNFFIRISCHPSISFSLYLCLIGRCVWIIYSSTMHTAISYVNIVNQPKWNCVYACIISRTIATKNCNDYSHNEQQQRRTKERN